jgi:hypothetical protein
MFQDGIADIQGTVTCMILVKIRIAIITRADDIPVLLSVSHGDAAWAGGIPEPFFIDKQPPDKTFRKFPVIIEVIAPLFRFPVEFFPPGFYLLI